MKLEVGMYIRTKEGKIDKVLEINTEDFDEPVVRLASYPIGMYQGNFEYVKANYELTDLIEIGDYVNGYEVIDFELTYFNGIDRRNEPKKIGIVVNKENKITNDIYKSEDIKSIVTKEQFRNISYEVSK